mgnify:FL=1
MRENLKSINNQRIKVIGEVGEFGSKSSYKSRPKDTVCLINLVDSNANELTDHLWFTIGKCFKSMQLSVGDKISFYARVKPYLKGYRGYREDVYKPVEKDYKLSHPNNFEKIDFANQLKLF